MTDMRQPSLKELVLASAARHQRAPFNGRVYAIDPGLTTGIALLQCSNGGEIQLITNFQRETRDLRTSTRYFLDEFQRVGPDIIVVEDYRVYKQKADQHVNSSLYTSQLIGGIEAMAGLVDVPMVKQPAGVAKAFCTDVQLKRWGFYAKGLRHGRDAVRHGVYYLIFGPSRDNSKAGQHVG